MNSRILIVEDSEFYGKLLKRTITSQLGLQVLWFKTYAETESVIEDSDDICIALLEFHLPDAMNGEIINLCVRYSIPSVVMTGKFSPDLQELIWSKRVIDYVLKEGGHALEYLVELVDRSIKNKKIGILIVDDSKVGRNHLRNLLETHQFKIYEAEHGLEGLEVLEKNQDIKLALVDYKMPVCNGFEFTKKVRQKYPLDKLAIIGISARGSHAMMIKFIKYGANDFITKPFISELLYCRVNQNIKIIESFETIRQTALIDHLTKIHNRRYLFEAGEVLFNSAKRNGTYLAVAMIDIDNFKQINDTMGHVTGDSVIKKVSHLLKDNIRNSDLIVRYGGEEFCIVSSNMDPKQAIFLFDNLRLKIYQNEFLHEGNAFQVSVSFGVCIEKKNTLTDMINAADEKLYEAKEQGKNKVCL